MYHRPKMPPGGKTKPQQNIPQPTEELCGGNDPNNSMHMVFVSHHIIFKSLFLVWASKQPWGLVNVAHSFIDTNRDLFLQWFISSIAPGTL